MKEIQAANQEILNWEDQERSVTLTNGQWRLLSTYLFLSQDYREGEVKKWEGMSEITNGNGLASKNAKFWKRTAENVEIIKNVIDERHTERRKTCRQ